MNSEDKMAKELTRKERLDVEIKKSLDARTKEFKEKINKLTYEKIKQALVPSKEPLKGYPHNESMVEAADSWHEEVTISVEDKDLEEFGGRGISAADKANLRRRIADKRKK